ncbi:MAG TPA: ferritin-like domain-containing protein [Aestuariivirgaceae bacterium]|nr:ferritin-like domain-containing protein [Aestuariivirgaceae bacterium]
MSMSSLQDLFIHHLKDVYYAEKKLLKALPKMASKATDPALRAGFEEHKLQTEEQVKRLEQVFELAGKKASGTTCPAIDGIVEEGEELMKEAEKGEVMDAGLIAAGQAAEHYEIARYGTLAAWAEMLDMGDAQKILLKTLEEEKLTDQKLSKLATQQINRKAA